MPTETTTVENSPRFVPQNLKAYREKQAQKLVTSALIIAEVIITQFFLTCSSIYSVCVTDHFLGLCGTFVKLEHLSPVTVHKLHVFTTLHYTTPHYTASQNTKTSSGQNRFWA